MTKKLAILLTFILGGLMILHSCSSNSGSDEGDDSEGLAIMKVYCFSCHNPTASEDNRIAPPMFAVKRHYKSPGVTRDQFIAAMVSFVNSPSKENAKMPGAVKKFGIMPKMGYSEDDIKLIAAYLWDNDLQKPDWFEAHRVKNHPEENDTNYLKKGHELALQTKAILGKNLKTALMKGGSEYALEFCNTRAIHLTDSMANELNAKIKRVSDQNRNPDNTANEMELAYINSAKQLIAKGKQVKGQIQEIDGKLIGYYPIMTNEMCIQCHGRKDSDINEATLAQLNALYPNDKATGYTADQLRGIWVVEMEK